MNIGQAPISEQYFNGQMTAAQLLGINAAGTSAYKPAGHSLPSSDAGAGDSLSVWWNPDSPIFWAAGLIALTVLGMAGADFKVRLFKGRAQAGIGTT